MGRWFNLDYTPKVVSHRTDPPRIQLHAKWSSRFPPACSMHLPRSILDREFHRSSLNSTLGALVHLIVNSSASYARTPLSSIHVATLPSLYRFTQTWTVSGSCSQPYRAVQCRSLYSLPPSSSIYLVSRSQVWSWTILLNFNRWVFTVLWSSDK